MPPNRTNQPNQLKHKAINSQKALPYIIHFVLCPIDENKQVIPENIISQIKKLFDENNISYWLDENGLSGQDFTHLIASKIRESSLFLFVSSEHSNRSKWTSREIGVADKF